MIPVNQTRVVDPNNILPPGNCFIACVASILKLPLSEIPDEADTWTPGKSHTKSWREWYPKFASWLKEKDLFYLETNLTAAFEAKYFQGSYCIVSGPSPRNKDILHAVVGYFGQHGIEIVHDPFPTKEGLSSNDEWTYGFFVKGFSK